jgi:hypothetical protein
MLALCLWLPLQAPHPDQAKAEQALHPEQILPQPENTSIVLAEANSREAISRHPHKFRIARSAHLGFAGFLQFNQSLVDAGYAPIVAPRCLQKFRREILSLSCADDTVTLQALHYSLQKSGCGEYVYSQGSTKPLFIYSHMIGFGNSDEAPFALEMIKLAKTFGFNFRHPYSAEAPTPITGYDLLRPALYASNQDFVHSTLFAPQKFLAAANRVLADRELSPLHKDQQLKKLTPPTHFAHPRTWQSFSAEAKQCCPLTQAELWRRVAEDKTHFLGGWSSLLEVLHMVLDPQQQPVVIFCYGGRHKTGMLTLALRYLQDARWFYGRTQKVGVLQKVDATLYSEEVSTADNPRGALSRRCHKRRALAMMLRCKVYEVLMGRHVAQLARFRWVRLNPAEQEYARHNSQEFRMVNLTSVRDMFRLLYEPSPALEARLLRDNAGFLSVEDIATMKKELTKLRAKMHIKFP